jgi:hypothetical protein
MSQSKIKLSRKQRMLLATPYCCFCGGTVRSTSEDHVPPRACFPPGYHPEGMEFPACDRCNQATRKHDDIFGFYSMALDFNEQNLEHDTLIKRGSGIKNNYAEAYPNFSLSANEKRKKLRRMGLRKMTGQSLSEIGMFHLPPDLKNALDIQVRKLISAIYFKETGKILSYGRRIAGLWQQKQDAERAPLTRYLNELLPEYRQPTRASIKDYGSRFCYKFGYMEDSDFFAFAAQIGDGFILMGLTLLQDASDPPLMKVWKVGDCWVEPSTSIVLS